MTRRRSIGRERCHCLCFVTNAVCISRVQGLNLAVNSYIKWALGSTTWEARLLGLMDLPKVRLARHSASVPGLPSRACRGPSSTL